MIPCRPRVLLVDDNRLFLRVLAATCRDLFPEAQLHGVVSGGAALSYCDSLAVSADGLRLVVLDFHLPDMDAPQLLERMRRSGAGRDVPILVLTQAYWLHDEMAARAAGATSFLAKPSSLVELRRALSDFWSTADVAVASGKGAVVDSTA